MKLSKNNQGKHGSEIYPIDCWVVGLTLIHPPFLHTSMGAQAVFVFDEPPIW